MLARAAESVREESRTIMHSESRKEAAICSPAFRNLHETLPLS
jgi:hypothetical protein